jgi:hypothetical protein
MGGELADKARLLKARDRKRAVFGAETHRYAMDRFDSGDREWLEKRLGMEAPPGYLRILEEVGFGRGPYHGLWDPARSFAERDAFCEEAANEGDPVPSLTEPFPHDSSGVVGPVNTPLPLLAGALPIADIGCGELVMLIVAGKERGRVWCAHHTGEYVWAPAGPVPTLAGHREHPEPSDSNRAPTFEDWYERWLDRALSLLGEPPAPSRPWWQFWGSASAT